MLTKVLSIVLSALICAAMCVCGVAEESTQVTLYSVSYTHLIDALDVRALRVVLAQFLRIGVEYGVSRLLQRTGAAPDASVGMKALVITATAEGDAQLKQQIVVQASVERRKQ